MPDPERLAAMRRSYRRSGLDAGDLAPTWLEQLRAWLGEAAELEEPNAMVLATAGEGGRPSARTVLLKGLDERGLRFYTNLDSRKGRELRANPYACVVFPWVDLQRQVTVNGSVEELSAAESDAYFATRPPGSRIGAAASPQSEVIPSRTVLEDARDALLTEHPEGDVPRPARWGGLCLIPETVEFWQGRPDRLHDRLRYRRAPDGDWVVERLAP
jgi:pyridoxamine 5'-phosphate oxidase